jgi:hypothetical protein
MLDVIHLPQDCILFRALARAARIAMVPALVIIQNAVPMKQLPAWQTVVLPHLMADAVDMVDCFRNLLDVEARIR